MGKIGGKLNEVVFVYIQVNEKSCTLRMAIYRNGIKKKGDEIGTGL